MRKYVIMGIQGSGKGTQSQLLAADNDLAHISVGDIFRWHVANHTQMGAQVRRCLAAGQLVGDDLVQSVIQRRLAEHDWNYGFIIDGFPRTVAQAEFFMENYDVDAVIHLDMPDAGVRARVASRRTDDVEEAIAVRLRDYHEQTEPAIDLFRRKEYVITVDATPAVEIIQQQIRERLGLPPMRPAEPAPGQEAGQGGGGAR
jgi:adenylate kinase